jgi:hypothetical protein
MAEFDPKGSEIKIDRKSLIMGILVENFTDYPRTFRIFSSIKTNIKKF